MTKRYTSAQKEILCDLAIGDDKNALEWQKKMAGKLASKMENDVEHTLFHANKIKKYQTFAATGETAYESTITEDIQTGLGWFTSVRLFIVRLHGFLKLFHLGFLPKIFDFLGLSYLLELIVDLVDIGVTTFSPLRQPERDAINNGKATRAKIYWWRFKNKMTQDDELIPRMLNAAVWFAINLASFILTGGFSSIITAIGVSHVTKKIVDNLNLGGFIFDFGIEVAKGIKAYWQHKQTLNAIEKQLDDLNQKLASKRLELNAIEYKRSPEYIKLFKECQKLELKINSRKTFKKKLKEKISVKLLPKHIYSWAVTGVIGVGMGMVACVGNVLNFVGRTMAFFGGSVFGGCGRRVWYKVSDWYEKIRAKFNKNKTNISEKSDADDHLYQSIDSETSDLDVTSHINIRTNSLIPRSENRAITPSPSSLLKPIYIDAPSRSSSPHHTGSHPERHKLFTNYLNVPPVTKGKSFDSKMVVKKFLDTNDNKENIVNNNSSLSSFSKIVIPTSPLKRSSSLKSLRELNRNHHFAKPNSPRQSPPDFPAPRLYTPSISNINV